MENKVLLTAKVYQIERGINHRKSIRDPKRIRKHSPLWFDAAQNLIKLVF